MTTSLLHDEGVEELEQAIAELFFEGELESDVTYVSNTRHIALLEQAKSTIEDAIEAIEREFQLI